MASQKDTDQEPILPKKIDATELEEANICSYATSVDLEQHNITHQSPVTSEKKQYKKIETIESGEDNANSISDTLEAETSVPFIPKII